jgi:hypothetical protein
MLGKGRRIFAHVMSIMIILAMVMLGPTGSQAKKGGPPFDPPPEKKPPIVKVPEPSTSLLLLLGISLTGLAGYSLQRRTHRK